MIGLQLHTYVETRLARWRTWLNAGSRPGPRRVKSWWGPSLLDPHIGQSGRVVGPKVDPTEAEETDRAVRALPYELRKAVLEVWTRGGTLTQKANALHCDRRTLYRRLERANTTLLGYFNDQAAGLALPAPDLRLKLA